MRVRMRIAPLGTKYAAGLPDVIRLVL
jgi:hypothetical protein